jgi:hypothetical protein
MWCTAPPGRWRWARRWRFWHNHGKVAEAERCLTASCAAPPRWTICALSARPFWRWLPRYGVYNVREFGSVARGDATPESDVDLLMDLPPHFNLLDMTKCFSIWYGRLRRPACLISLLR